VHAIFETLPSDDWEGGLAAMDPARIQQLVRRALVHTPHDQVTFAEAAQSALDTWQSFRSSTLCTQLEQIWPRVIARELPLFVAAPANETEGAVHGLRGTADMVYRDLDGSLVVVDWKTDRVADLAARSQQYVEQLKVYALALRAALDLNYTPRCELWFVAQGVLHK
jgi:ATP-dependent exoDNAse (exonuclease V) beta subunit